jgi:ankyrin repeat protein
MSSLYNSFLVSDLFEFCAHGKYEELEELLSEEPEIDIEITDKNGKTPLIRTLSTNHWGIDDKLLRVIKILLKNGANTEARDQNGNTALCLASWNGKIEFAKILLEYGACIEAKNNDESTPLNIASYEGYYPDYLLFLIGKGADIHSKDREGESTFSREMKRYEEDNTDAYTYDYEKEDSYKKLFKSLYKLR